MAVVGVHVLGAAGQILSGRLQRLALGAAWRPAATGVQVISGILAGPANTQGELSLAGGVLTVQPFRAVIQSALDATAGSYLIPNDAPVSFTLTAQHASQYRRSLVVVRVDDSQVSGVASSGTTDRGVLEVIDGGLAASQAATVLPTPAGSWLALGEVLIPPTGQTVTVTPYNPRTGVRGGILPVVADGSTIAGHDGAPGVSVGQYRDHPTYGLQRWTGAAWVTPTGLAPVTPVLSATFINYDSPLTDFQPLRIWTEARTGFATGFVKINQALAAADYTVCTIPAGMTPTQQNRVPGIALVNATPQRMDAFSATAATNPSLLRLSSTAAAGVGGVVAVNMAWPLA